MHCKWLHRRLIHVPHLHVPRLQWRRQRSLIHVPLLHAPRLWRWWQGSLTQIPPRQAARSRRWWQRLILHVAPLRIPRLRRRRQWKVQPRYHRWALLPSSNDSRGDRASRTSTVTLVRGIPSCARQCCTTLEPCLARTVPRRGKWTGFAESTRSARVRPGAVRRPQRTIFTQNWRRRNLSANGDLPVHPDAAHWVLRGRPHQADCIRAWCPWGACAHPAGGSRR